MANFKENLAQAREILKGLLNENNIDKVAEGSNALDAMEKEYEASQKEAQGAKDKLVEYVGKYAFKDEPKDDAHLESPKSLDELFAEEFKN